MPHTFRMPHKSAKPKELALELTHIIEDNAKLHAELCPFPCLVNGRFSRLGLFNNQFQDISKLSSAEVKKIHEDLWKFYYTFLEWIAVARLLKIEISDPQNVQRWLDDTWYLLDKNPYTRISCQKLRDLTSEELSNYQQILIEYSNRKR